MQIVELYTFRPVLVMPGSKQIKLYESGLRVREGFGGKEYEAKFQHTRDEIENHRDLDGFYNLVVRELRRSIEKHVTNQCFEPLN